MPRLFDQAVLAISCTPYPQDRVTESGNIQCTRNMTHKASNDLDVVTKFISFSWLPI
jgi:hypothetical protein